jgi:hypothetical protein
MSPSRYNTQMITFKYSTAKSCFVLGVQLAYATQNSEVDLIKRISPLMESLNFLYQDKEKLLEDFKEWMRELMELDNRNQEGEAERYFGGATKFLEERSLEERVRVMIIITRLINCNESDKDAEQLALAKISQEIKITGPQFSVIFSHVMAAEKFSELGIEEQSDEDFIHSMVHDGVGKLEKLPDDAVSMLDLLTPNSSEEVTRKNTVSSKTDDESFKSFEDSTNNAGIYELKISARALEWPPFCSCCREPTSNTEEITHSRSKGVRVVRVTTKQWDIPICNNCLSHGKSAATGRDIGAEKAPKAAWTGFCITGGIAAYYNLSGDSSDFAMLMVAMSATSGFIGMYFDKKARENKEKRKRKEWVNAGRMLSESCAAPVLPVTFYDWESTWLTFRFTSPRYLNKFLEANKKKRMEDVKTILGPTFQQTFVAPKNRVQVAKVSERIE